MVLATLLSCWRVGQRNVQEWDEGRNGATAYAMYQNHDWVNFYYMGGHDTWSAKPPLVIWLTVAAYHVVGFNEWGLRLPSVIACIICFAFFYRMVARFAGERTAFIASLMLLCCRAYIGDHMGITGDFDMPLVLWLTCAAYYFLRYTEEGDQPAVVYCAVFMGLAFYTKGSAALPFLPIMGLYLLLKGRFKAVMSARSVWLAILLMVAIMGSWIVIVAIYGAHVRSSFYGSSNAVETMLVHDTWRRLVSKDFSDEYHKNYGFFFVTLDLRFNIWNYLFYIATLIAGYRIYKQRGRGLRALLIRCHPLVLLSWCVIIPYALLMSFASFKHNWYMAPAFGFVAFVTAYELLPIIKKQRVALGALGCLLVFALVRQFLMLNDAGATHYHNLFQAEKERLGVYDTMTVVATPRQDVYLYLLWMNKQMQYGKTIKQAAAVRANLIFAGINDQPKGYVADTISPEFKLLRRTVSQ